MSDGAETKPVQEGSAELPFSASQLNGFRRTRRQGLRVIRLFGAELAILARIAVRMAQQGWWQIVRGSKSGAAWFREGRAGGAVKTPGTGDTPTQNIFSRLHAWRAKGFQSSKWRSAPGGTRSNAWPKFGVAAIALLLISVTWIYVWALREVPWKEIAEGTLEPVIMLEAANGDTLVSQGAFRGPYTTLSDFPSHLINAVLSIEDRRFRSHWGVDPQGIARAAWRNLISGGVVEGGSTITQQLIKILYLERERTFRRKVQELAVALWLERRLGKDEILTRYLNNVYLGAGATGMPAAARIYFNKEVQELTLSEAAMLAGLIRAPSQLNPLTNMEGARQRASAVIQAMAQTNSLDADQVETAAVQFAQLRPSGPEKASGSWFSDWVMEEAREIAGPFRGTIRMRTTIVPELQRLAEQAIGDGLRSAKATEQAALVALTPDGAIVAMVGGADYRKSTFNRTTAKRQPGSTFKLFVYYAALKAGLDPRDKIDDRPIEVDGWSPKNAGGRFHGRVSLAEAFASSLNAATVRLALKLGPEAVIAAARDLGLDADLKPHPSMALGTAEASLLDLTGAYASIRAGVAPVEPWGVREFRAGDQSRAFRAAPGLPQPSPEHAALQAPMVRMLQLVVERGTGKAARLDGFAAGKTGTTQNNRDGWFIGFNEALVVGVWVGNDDNTPMEGVTGGSLPAQIWKRFMTDANELLLKPGQEKEQDDDGELMSSVRQSRLTRAAEVPCNVRACSRAYRSFRAVDCTYQPWRGERRQCTR